MNRRSTSSQPVPLAPMWSMLKIFGSVDTDYSAYTMLEIEGDTTGGGDG